MRTPTAPATCRSTRWARGSSAWTTRATCTTARWKRSAPPASSAASRHRRRERPLDEAVYDVGVREVDQVPAAGDNLVGARRAGDRAVARAVYLVYRHVQRAHPRPPQRLGQAPLEERRRRVPYHVANQISVAGL